jgi:hypothetical protein
MQKLIAIEETHYFRPEDRNFPVIDAAIKSGKCIVGLNMTLANEHPISARVALDLVNGFPKGTQFYLVWVVAHDDKLEHAQSIKQSSVAAERVTTKQLDMLQVHVWRMKTQETVHRDVNNSFYDDESVIEPACDMRTSPTNNRLPTARFSLTRKAEQFKRGPE